MYDFAWGAKYHNHLAPHSRSVHTEAEFEQTNKDEDIKLIPGDPFWTIMLPILTKHVNANWLIFWQVIRSFCRAILRLCLCGVSMQLGIRSHLCDWYIFYCNLV